MAAAHAPGRPAVRCTGEACGQVPGAAGTGLRKEGGPERETWAPGVGRGHREDSVLSHQELGRFLKDTRIRCLTSRYTRSSRRSSRRPAFLDSGGDLGVGSADGVSAVREKVSVSTQDSAHGVLQASPVRVLHLKPIALHQPTSPRYIQPDMKIK